MTDSAVVRADTGLRVHGAGGEPVPDNPSSSVATASGRPGASRPARRRPHKWAAGPLSPFDTGPHSSSLCRDSSDGCGPNETREVRA